MRRDKKRIDDKRKSQRNRQKSARYRPSLPTPCIVLVSYKPVRVELAVSPNGTPRKIFGKEIETRPDFGKLAQCLPSCLRTAFMVDQEAKWEE